MSKTPVFMTFYVKDYLADTGHLSTFQHGIYLLLIFHYWQRGSLPSDDAALARIAGCTFEEWRENRPVISQLFTKSWKHKRIDAELKEARERIERRSAAAKRRWRKASKVVPFKPLESKE